MDLGFFTEKLKIYVFTIKSCLLLGKGKLYGNTYLEKWIISLVNRNSSISTSLHAINKRNVFLAASNHNDKRIEV